MALPQKIKNRIATWSSNFTSRCMPPKNQQQGLEPTHCHSGTIHNIKRWEQSTFQHWWINGLKQYGLHKQWSDSALKRKEILRHATSWMNLQRHMLSEISQSQEDKCRMIPLISEGPGVVRFMETERAGVVRAGGEENEGLTFMSAELWFCKMRRAQVA